MDNYKLNEKNDLNIISKYRTKIMGFAAIMILIHHIWIIYTDKVSYLGFISIFLKEFGNYGVDIFFLLSGLGCYIAINKNSVAHFYYKRFKRIYFTYSFFVAIECIILHNNIFEYFKIITLYNFFSININSNNLWFIGAIMILYLIFPIYYKIFSSVKNKTNFTIYIMFSYILIYHLGYSFIRNDLFMFLERIPIFLIGIWLCWFIMNRNFKMSFKKEIIIHISLIIAIVIEYFRIYHNHFAFMHVFPKIIIGLSLTLILAKLFDNNSNKLSDRIFNFMGTLSLQLYCVQEFVGYNLLLILKNYHPILIQIFLIVTIIISAYILYIIDKCFWKMLNKYYYTKRKCYK